MNDDAALKKEIAALRKEVEQLKGRVSQKANVNPHDYAYRALRAIESVHDYLGGGVGTPEKTRDIVETLRGTAYGRAGDPHFRADFVFATAELIESVYLSSRASDALRAYAHEKRLAAKKRGKSD